MQEAEAGSAKNNQPNKQNKRSNTFDKPTFLLWTASGRLCKLLAKKEEPCLDYLVIAGAHNYRLMVTAKIDKSTLENCSPPPKI